MFEGYGQQILAVQPSQRQRVDVSLWACMRRLPAHDPEQGEKVRLFYIVLLSIQ